MTTTLQCAQAALRLIHQSLVECTKADVADARDDTPDHHWIARTCEKYSAGERPCAEPILPQMLYLLEAGYAHNHGQPLPSPHDAPWNRSVSVQMLEQAGYTLVQIEKVCGSIVQPEWVSATADQ